MTKPPPYQPGRFVKISIAFVVVLMLAFTVFSSIPRKDVLVCGFPDGSRFILTSRYDKILFNLNFRSAITEKNRTGWGIEYKDANGHRSDTNAGMHFTRNISVACTEAGGKRNGVAMVGHSFLQQNGEWLPIKYFPWEQMRIPSDARDMLESKFGKAGFFDAPLLFGLIRPLRDGRLVLEQPLESNPRIGKYFQYDRVFDGVYQSFSTDNGKTWSDPVITTDALIFQMGKRWINQCFVARPIEFNGEKITPDFPEPCPPNP